MRLLLSASLLLLFTPTYAATTITIDPGDIGKIFDADAEYLVTEEFKSAFGVTVSGQDVEVEFRFEENKFLMPRRGGMAGTFNGMDTVLLVYHPDDLRFYEDWEPSPSQLNSLNGTILPTRSFTSYHEADTEVWAFYDDLDAGDGFLGQSMSFTLPNFGFEIQEVRLSFQRKGEGFFQVGAVPEPSSVALLSIGTIGLMTVRRRRC